MRFVRTLVPAALAVAVTLAAPAARSQTTEWMAYASPAEAGFSAEALDAARAFADENRAAAVMAIYRGHVVAAWGDVARPFMAHSVRKSLAGALYGQAIAEGRIALTDTLAALGVDDTPALTDAEKAATFGHLIASRSGVYHTAAYADAGQDRERPARGAHAPGTFFFYNNWDFNAAEQVFERRTGEDLYAAFDRRIARPLGMQDFDPRQQFEVLEPSRSRLPAHTMRISARDLARFGQLYLQRGQWQGRTVLPASWIDDSWRMHTTLPDGSGYGYLWWIFGPGSLGPSYPALNAASVYLARGTGGQTLFVIPSLDMVIVHRADTDNGRSVQGPRIWQLVERLAAARTGTPATQPRLVPMAASPLTSTLPAPPAETFVPVTAALIARVAGAYADAVRPEVITRVFEHEGRLFMSLPGEGEAEIFPTGDGRFTVRVQPGIRVTFDLPAEGPATRVTVAIGARVFRFTRT